MAIVNGTALIDRDGNILKDNLENILLCMPYSENNFIPDYTRADLERAVRSYISVPIYKVELLNNDETPLEDLSTSLVESSINYSQEFQSGQTRSLSFNLIDNHGSYFPSHVGRIWYGTKIRFSLGLLVKNTVVFFPKGIFAVKDASYNYGVLSLQLCDKFGLIDGTISGTTESKYEIPSNNIPIKVGIETLLALDNGTGKTDDDGNIIETNPFDTKMVMFPAEYDVYDEEGKPKYVVPYTIKNDYKSSIGKIIIELAEIISCVVFYDDYGHLTLQPMNEITDTSVNEIDWRYIDGECQFSNTNMNIQFPNIVNKVMVVGSNINGYLFKHTAQNTNPASPTAIGNSPVRFQYISDSNIYTDELCKVRAEYELEKATILATPISFQSIYIPFLTANHLIEYTNDMILYGESGNTKEPRRVFENEKLILTSISVSGTGTMNVSAKNIRELPFYG